MKVAHLTFSVIYDEREHNEETLKELLKWQVIRVVGSNNSNSNIHLTQSVHANDFINSKPSQP